MNIRFVKNIFDKLNVANSNEACSFGEKSVAYSDFTSMVGTIQLGLLASESKTFGIIAQNEPETYAAIIACWLSGKAYVPLNPSYPADRINAILTTAEIEDLLYCREDEELSQFKKKFTEKSFTSTQWDGKALSPVFQSFGKETIAYILFTSGTTGKPKGVPISFGNLEAFTEGFIDLGYNLSSSDRFLQMFDLTFDLSVMSFSIPLSIGASFHTLPGDMVKTMALYHTLESKEITFALMVPSAIQLLSPFMDDIELPRMRYSQFCGEALKSDLVQKWSKCVPQAVIDNVYGPTEATIYCTAQRVHPSTLAIPGLNGIAGIGKAMKHVKTGIFSEGQEVLETDMQGELCLAGEQITSGYLNNPEQNQHSFFYYGGSRFYKTGDIVQRTTEGNFMYLGRIDDQVKIQGFRIELAELELASARILPEHQAVAVGVKDQMDNWILALFVLKMPCEADWLRNELGKILPTYMLPQIVLTIEEFPLNANGKTDRKLLRQMINMQA